MLGAALIVFRETLEAALIVAIALGASRGIAGRRRWVGAGIAAGLLGAVAVAGSARAVANALDGRGQELLNAAVLLAAVGMLTWHKVWMSAHGRELAGRLRAIGHDVGTGARPLIALALVTLLAVLREGSETVLFLYGLVASGTGSTGLLAGGALGIVAGAALGHLVYRGLLAIPIARFFQVTGWLVVLLAAGLAANAAGYLTQAGLLPILMPYTWDTSWLLDQQSLLGNLLHVLVGYNDHPTGIQVVFYLTTLAAMHGLSRRFATPGHPRRAAAR
ncbi:MAG: FTR1 family protein [Ectothiorhodospiraceae bacterium]|nr:FTR1 family protein [Ectothiorhodospiraceae bacterium]